MFGRATRFIRTVVKVGQPKASCPVLIAASGLVVGIAGADAVWAEAAADAILLPSQRSIGERFVIDTTATTQRLSGSKVTQVWRRETVATATAEAVSSAGYVLDLDTVDYQILGDHRLPTGLAGRLEELHKAIPVKLAMTAAGTVDSIANLPDVLSVSHKSMSETARFYDSLDMSPVASAALDEILSELADPAMVQRAILEMPKVYFSLAGRELEPEVTYYVDDAVVFPLFSEPLPSRNYFGVRSVNPDAGTVTLDWWQTPDQAAFHDRLGALMQAFMGDDVTPIELDLTEFGYSAEAVLVYSTETGLPLSMEYVREILLPDRRTIETVQARTRFD